MNELPRHDSSEQGEQSVGLNNTRAITTILHHAGRYGKTLLRFVRRCLLKQTPPASNNTQVVKKPVQSVNLFAAELAQMEKILASDSFIHSQKCSRLLRYIVEKSLRNQEAELKESVIAIEVFGRKPDFDGGTDNVVRTNAHRTRLRLMEYYVTYGGRDRMIIGLPKGRYVATFRIRSDRSGSTQRNNERLCNGEVAEG